MLLCVINLCHGRKYVKLRRKFTRLDCTVIVADAGASVDAVEISDTGRDCQYSELVLIM